MMRARMAGKVGMAGVASLMEWMAGRISPVMAGKNVCRAQKSRLGTTKVDKGVNNSLKK